MDPLEPLLGNAGGVFRQMEIADRVLLEVGGDTPFLALRPEALLAECADWVYEAHVRELAKRNGENLALATYAECAMAMSATCRAAPLNEAGRATFEWLFRQIASPDMVAQLEGRAALERWEGQVAEDVSDMQRRLAQPWRDELDR